MCGCGLCWGVWVWTVAVLGCVDCGCVGVCWCGLCWGVWVWTELGCVGVSTRPCCPLLQTTEAGAQCVCGEPPDAGRPATDEGKSGEL